MTSTHGQHGQHGISTQYKADNQLRGELKHRADRATVQGEPDAFVLELRALTTGWTTPPVQRLRLALRTLLRGYGLKAESVKPKASTLANAGINRKTEI